MTVHPFLVFHGNCREALLFYQSCFGGELRLVELGQSAATGQMPETMKRLILHGSLDCGSFVLQASDLGNPSGSGNGKVSLLITCRAAEAKRIWNALRPGGNATGDCTGGTTATLVDKFGVEWIFAATD